MNPKQFVVAAFALLSALGAIVGTSKVSKLKEERAERDRQVQTVINQSRLAAAHLSELAVDVLAESRRLRSEIGTISELRRVEAKRILTIHENTGKQLGAMAARAADSAREIELLIEALRDVDQEIRTLEESRPDDIRKWWWQKNTRLSDLRTQKENLISTRKKLSNQIKEFNEAREIHRKFADEVQRMISQLRTALADGASLDLQIQHHQTEVESSQKRIEDVMRRLEEIQQRQRE